MVNSGEHLGLNLSGPGVPTSALNPLASMGSLGGEQNSSHQEPSQRSQDEDNTHPTTRHPTLTRPSSPHLTPETGSNEPGATQGSRPSTTDEVSNLQASVGQMQKDVGTLMELLLSDANRGKGPSTSSNTNNPYFTTSNPTPHSVSDPNLGAWATLPALFSGTNPGATLSLLPKKPEIADVVPGHIASHFTTREYHVAKYLNCFLFYKEIEHPEMRG